eukprot:SAG31_NODE_8168_length_1504_cov_4.112289_2_plen_166_part_00
MLPGRRDNAIKNYWNSRTFQAKIAEMEARMAEQGTRRPLQIPVGDAPPSPKKDGNQQANSKSAASKGRVPNKKLEADAAKGKENSKPSAPRLVVDTSTSSSSNKSAPKTSNRARPSEFMAGEAVLAESDGAWYEATVMMVTEPSKRVQGKGFYFVHYAAWYGSWL